MPEIPTQPQQNSTSQPQIAELSPKQRKNLFYRRYLALSIDALIIYFIPLAYFIYTLYTGSPAKSLEFLISIESFAGNLFFITAAVVAFFYNTIALAKYGTTIGKHFLGIKVVSSQGQIPTILQAATRELIKWLPSLIFPPAFFVVAGSAYYNKFGQGLHDKLAKTYFFESRQISKAGYNLSRALIALVPLLFTLLLAPLILSVTNLFFSEDGFRELLTIPKLQQVFEGENDKRREDFAKSVSVFKEFTLENKRIPTQKEWAAISGQNSLYYRLCSSLGKDNTALLVLPLHRENTGQAEKDIQPFLVYRSKIGKIEEVIAKEEPACLTDQDKQNDLKEAVKRLEGYRIKTGRYPYKREANVLNSLGIAYGFADYEQCLDSAGRQAFALAVKLDESNKVLTFKSKDKSYQTSELPKPIGRAVMLSCP